MSSEENQRRDLKRRREPSIGSSTSSTDSNSNTTMANMYKKKKSTHAKTCEDCERLKASISNQHSRITERFSQSLSDGSHKRQKTNSGGNNLGQVVSHERISFATIGNNLGQAVKMGESSHAMNVACGDVAVAISTLLFNLREEKLLSDDEYYFLMSTRALVEGLWPSTLLGMNHTKERIASLLKDFFNRSVKGSKE